MDKKITTENILIISEFKSKSFNMSGDINAINSFFYDFFSIFSKSIENQTIIFQTPFIQVTEIIKSNILELVEKWKPKLIQVYQIKKFFDQIPIGKYISILPKSYIDSSKQLQAYLYFAIKKLNSGISLDDVLQDESIMNEYNYYFLDLQNKYTVECNSSYIGIKDRNKRTCRFCGESQPKVTFREIAHAIPEALGNKTIINNEECDSCNHKFGNSLDNELINYLSFYRSLFGIKGKNGTVETKFLNGKMKYKKHEVNICSQDIIFDKDNNPKTIILKNSAETILQNIYKALVRITMGTITEFDKEIYKNTINWINDSNSFYDSLPKIAFNLNQINIEKPFIINFLKKVDEEDLPFLVSELHLQFLVIIFIVPVKNSDISFVDSNKYDKFWSTFKHFSMNNNWRFFDLSSKIPQKIQFKMNMEKEK